MSYSAPYIDSSGLILPTYEDILEELISQMQSIYGSDIYLENDSADYQFLSVLALKMYETMQTGQLAYNNRGPLTAIGSGLDSLVKINGLARKAATYSTCAVVLTGLAGTVVTDGVVSDINGNKWNLPSSVTIGEGGTVTTTATCQTIGAISALTGNINSIFTPTLGWTSVTNLVAATLGVPAETDAELRARQALSTKLASHTILSGTIAAIAAVAGVTRYNIVENNTDAYDAYGNPPHSITCVVEGGTDDDVAMAIYQNKSLGCYTNGDTEVVVSDPDSGEEFTVRFYRPTDIPIYVGVDVTPLTGYVTATKTAIQEAIADYLNSLQIGEDLTISALYGAALAVMDDLTKPIFSITSLKAGAVESPLGTTDIAIDFNEVTQGLLGSPVYIVINDGD